MAITSFDPRNPQLQVGGTNVPQVISFYQEVDSQSFLAGEFVSFAAAVGDAVQAATTGDLPIAGIALADATNVTSGNATIPVQVIGPNDEVLIQVAANGGAVEPANTTCKPGVAYDIQVVSNHHTIDSSDTTNPKFVFLGPVLDSAGDVTVWGRFRPYYLENQVIAG
jgi:hypothetical protein